MFVSAHSLRAISKYYAHQDESSLDKLCHWTNHMHTFILAKLHNVLFALYFGTIARRSPSPAGISRSSHGSVGSTENIRIRVEEDCEVSESTPLLAATQRSIKSPTSSATSSSSSSPSPETRSSQKTVSIGDRSDFWSCVPPPWHWPSIYSGNKVSFPADGGRSGRVRARFAFLKINKSELAVSYDKLNL